MRQVPAKNYAFCVLLVGITVVLTYYLCSIYKKEETYTSAMSGFLTEIKEDDIDDYLVENAVAVLYISDKKDESLKEKEEALKNFLSLHNIQQYFAYIDISENMKEFEDKYKVSLNDKELPILIAIEDGEIKEIYAGDGEINSIEQFLKRNEVIESD